MLVVLAAVAALAAGSDASPASNTPAPSPASHTESAVQQANDLNTVKCRSEAITGSRFVKRVCMTRAEWNERTRQAEELQRQITEHTAMGNQSVNPLGGN